MSNTVRRGKNAITTEDTATNDEEFIETINFNKAQEAVNSITHGLSNNDLLAQMVAQQREMINIMHEHTTTMRDLILMTSSMKESIGELNESMLTMRLSQSNQLSTSTINLINNSTTAKVNDKNEVLAMVLLQVYNLALNGARQRGINYYCARTLEVSKLKQICRIIAKVKNIAVPHITDPSIIFVSQRIFSAQKGVIPSVTLDTFYEITMSNVALPLMSAIREIHRYLLQVRESIPYIYGDILAAIDYPYVRSTPDMELNCNWDKIIPRTETLIERRLAEMTIMQRYHYIERVLDGDSKISAVDSAARFKDEKKTSQ